MWVTRAASKKAHAAKQKELEDAFEFKNVPPMDETRTVSATGGAKGVKIARYDQIPPSVLRELAEHCGRGGEKYGHGNWRKGFEWWKSYRSAIGHLNSFWEGEDLDLETGSKHVISAMWHCMALAWYMDNMPEYDTKDTFRHSGGLVPELDSDRS